MNPVLFLLVAVAILNAASQLLLKIGVSQLGGVSFAGGQWVSTLLRVAMNLPIMAGLSLYVFGVGLWLVLLSRVEVSVAYPMSSLGYIIAAFAAWWWLGENVTSLRILGILVIILGVWIVGKTA